MGRQPAEVFHPSFTIVEEIEARGWSQKELAGKLRVSLAYANDLVNARRGISTRIAVALEQAGLASAEFWLKMQATYDLGLYRAILREKKKQKH